MDYTVSKNIYNDTCCCAHPCGVEVRLHWTKLALSSQLRAVHMDRSFDVKLRKYVKSKDWQMDVVPGSTESIFWKWPRSFRRRRRRSGKVRCPSRGSKRPSRRAPTLSSQSNVLSLNELHLECGRAATETVLDSGLWPWQTQSLCLSATPARINDQLRFRLTWRGPRICVLHSQIQ